MNRDRIADGFMTACGYALLATVLIVQYRDEIRAWNVRRAIANELRKERDRRFAFLRSIYRPDGSHDSIGIGLADRESAS